MALTSLIIKIGAQDEGIQKALESIGVKTKSLDADLSKLGNTPVGAAAAKSLEAMQASIKKVTDAQEKLADKAVSAAKGLEVIGGVSKLTTTELASMNKIALQGIDAFKALGKDVPASLSKMADDTKKVASAGKGFTSFLGEANGLLATFGVSLSIGAVVGFGKELLRMGDEIQRVSDRTGLSTKEVQEFSYVAGQSGNSIDELTGALGQMQNRLVSGDKGAVTAVKALGINLDQLMKLSPADQMEMLAAAIAKVPDPAQRTAVAMDLFGKSGAAILPTLTSDFAKLRKEAPIMSDATVKALDSAGDALGLFGTKIKVWAAESYNFARQGFDALTKAAFNAIAKMRELTIAVLKIIEYVPGASRAFGALGINIEKLSADAQWYRDAAKAMDVQTEAVGKTAAAAAPKLKLYSAETDKAAKAAETFAGHMAELTSSGEGWIGTLNTISGVVVEAIKFYLQAGVAQADLAAVYALTATQVKSVASALEAEKKALVDDQKALDATITRLQVFGKVGEEGASAVAKGMLGMSFVLSNMAVQMGTLQLAATKTFAGIGTLMPDISAQAKTHMQGLRGELIAPLASLGASMKGILAGVPQTIVSAFTGGGGLFGAVQGIGTQVASTLGDRLGKGISALGSLGGPIGAAIGSLAGPLIGMFGKMFSSAEKQINPLRQTFVDTAGGLDALNKKAAAAGVTLTALLNAKNPEQYKKAVDDLNAAFEANAKRVADVNTEFATLMGSAQEVGIQLPASMQAGVDKLKEMGILTGENAALFATLTGSNEVNFKKMEETAKKYGIELEALGPKFQSAKLHDSAKNIINDFEMLTKNGADVGGVLKGMAGEISTLVQDSLKFGVDIPANMKPWIEHLRDTGQLLDANGKQITDLSGIKFAAPIVSEFDKIVNKLQELIDKITGPTGITKAINAIPTSKTVQVSVQTSYTGERDFAAMGGLVTPSGIQHFASGGRVLPFLRRGTDTVPAMLTPGEMVLNEAQQRSVSQAMGGSTVDLSGLRSDMAALRSDMARDRADGPRRTARALTAALQTAGLRK